MPNVVVAVKCQQISTVNEKQGFMERLILTSQPRREDIQTYKTTFQSDQFTKQSHKLHSETSLYCLSTATEPVGTGKSHILRKQQANQGVWKKSSPCRAHKDGKQM